MQAAAVKRFTDKNCLHVCSPLFNGRAAAMRARTAARQEDFLRAWSCGVSYPADDPQIVSITQVNQNATPAPAVVNERMP